MDTEIDKAARRYFHIEKLFPQQRLAIANILSASRGGEAPLHQLIILPTGMGKSICFMLPAALGDFVTLVIFPLLSLINDQKRRFDEAGIPSAIVSGGQSREERSKILRSIEEGQIRALLTNPECLGQERLQRSLSRCKAIHLVVDEAHTVCMWGESFRPSFLELPAIIKKLGIKQISAFTATASPRIQSAVIRILFQGETPELITEIPDRPNISYRLIPSLSRRWDIYRLLFSPPSRSFPFAPLPRPAIVFCRTRIDCELLSDFLRRNSRKREIRFFHAGLEKREKEALAAWFFDSREGVLVATNAYGMGVDKKDIRTVIHHRLSDSPEAFLQESGRAGRDRQQSYSVALIGPDDNKSGELFQAFTKTSICRRAELMRLMNARIPECGGCDICNGDAVKSARGAEELFAFCSLLPFRYSASRTAELLSEMLKDYSREELREIAREMISHRAGLVRLPTGSSLIAAAGFPFSTLRSYRSLLRATVHNLLPQHR